jgi:hypothetical protein
MADESPRPEPAGKSKTDLRRGQFTPGNPSAKKRSAPPRDTSTTNAEQAALFGEDEK